MSRARIPPDWEVARLWLVYGFMILGALVLAGKLWTLQVARGREYVGDLDRQSVRRVRIPAIRGLIFDRHGRSLAENRPSFSLALNLEELRPSRRGQTLYSRVNHALDDLSARLGRERQISTNDITQHIKRRLPIPLIAWRDLDEQSVARWAEWASDLRGVELIPEPVRVYPGSNTACHVLGYVGRSDPAPDDSEPFHYYLPGLVGRTGLERRYDDLLRGEAGGQLVRVDAAGFRHHLIGGRAPKPGRDLQLTLDLRIQQLAEQALGDVAGAAVVLDPRDGAILAMASNPGFDPNAFVPSIPGELWSALRSDPLTPLMNRATQGAYAPGSIFKPVTALAALQAGDLTPAQTWNCSGVFQLGRRPIRCWDRAGHGTVNLQQAIKYSCNVYFFHAALACGHGPVAAAARRLGLGRRSGVDLDVESSGLVPDDAWKRAALKEGWRDGDTCNLAIGQGALSVTPLQMAVVAAALANGGRLVHPHVVRGTREHAATLFEPVPLPPPQDLQWNPAHLRVIRDGMRDVVMAPDGTGRKAQIPGVTVAGKTGTAEYGRKEEGRKRGWMIAFAPYEAPVYAIAMVVEEADSGGRTVAPRLQSLLGGLFERTGELRSTGPGDDPVPLDDEGEVFE